MTPLLAGKDAVAGAARAGEYARHRPEQTLLYQLVEQYYPAFVEHLAVRERTTPQSTCMVLCAPLGALGRPSNLQRKGCVPVGSRRDVNPGLVGLGILDAFVFGLATLATACGSHSPEISYLENGVNGLITTNNTNTYVLTGGGLLRDNLKMEALRRGSAANAQEYTTQNMARRFADGLSDALLH